MNAIEIQNLTKYYGKSRGIVDLSLSVPEGEFFGFIGPNGAGKSTTIRTLLGLIRADSGKAMVFGKDITRKKEAILADIGYMPSEAVFYTGMKVREIIRMSAKLHGQDCQAEAKILCDRLCLDVNKKVEELSLGNRKKVAVVCALQHKPKLCIMDEPTSGLDPLMQREFFAILEERNREGATIFLSSHVLSEIQRHCGRAAIICSGSVAACDTVDALSHTSARKITLHGTQSVPQLSGIREVQTEGDAVTFLYQGEIRELLKSLVVLPFTDISITEPELDEIFLNLYIADCKTPEKGERVAF